MSHNIVYQQEDNATQKLQRLHQAALMVAGAHNIDQALQVIVDAARETIGAEYGALGVPGKDGAPMERFIVSGIDNSELAKIGQAPVGRGILGQLLEGKNIRLNNIEQHPHYTGYNSKHPPIKSFLGVPIRVDGVPMANLYLANKLKNGEGFTESDEQLTEMLAAHAGVVIQNLRYQEQAREMAVLKDREAIARNIQDDVVQSIYGVGLMMRTLDVNDPKTAAVQLQEMRLHLDAAIESLRGHLLSLSRRK